MAGGVNVGRLLWDAVDFYGDKMPPVAADLDQAVADTSTALGADPALQEINGRLHIFWPGDQAPATPTLWLNHRRGVLDIGDDLTLTIDAAEQLALRILAATRHHRDVTSHA